MLNSKGNLVKGRKRRRDCFVHNRQVIRAANYRICRL